MSEKYLTLEQAVEFERERRAQSNGRALAVAATEEPIVWKTAAALAQKEFAPVSWAVPGIFVEGLSLLGGKPKRGKSWLALNCAIARASGGMALGSIKCEERDVLALMLEDNERRIKDRLRQIDPSMRWPLRLVYETEWPRLDAGGLERMERWLQAVKQPGLIIVDVLECVRGNTARRNSAYADDYGALRGLQEFSSRHRVPVIVVVHCRKAGSDDDVFDEISSTTGLTGAADSALVLKRGSEGRADFLYGRGRDLPEFEKAISFDQTRGLWTVLGEASDFRGAEMSRHIIDALSEASEPMSLRDIQAAVGGDYDALKQRLYRMSSAGDILKPERGKYAAR